MKWTSYVHTTKILILLCLKVFKEKWDYGRSNDTDLVILGWLNSNFWLSLESFNERKPWNECERGITVVRELKLSQWSYSNGSSEFVRLTQRCFVNDEICPWWWSVSKMWVINVKFLENYSTFALNSVGYQIMYELLTL